MSPQINSNSTEVHNHPDSERLDRLDRHHTYRRGGSSFGGSLLLFLLLLALIGSILEYFGVINVIPNFGRRGRPSIELGIWQPQQFSDVPNDLWAKPYIEDLAQQGVIKGFPQGNEFRPNQPITRAEFAAMLNAAFNHTPTPRLVRSIYSYFDSNAVPLTGGFTDVAPTSWAASAIADTVESGSMSGFPSNEFRPNQEISRAAALVAIANELRLNPESANLNALSYYQDASQIPEYAKTRIAALTDAGIQLNQSEPPALRPQQPLTRAEAALLVDKALEQQNSQK